MKRAIIISPLLCCVLLAVGCGGGASGISNPYQGVYNGTFSSRVQTGTANLNIDGGGVIAGQTVANSTSAVSDISGTISANTGFVTAGITSGGVTKPLGGFLFYDKNHNLVGSLSVSNGASTINFVLAPSASARNRH